MCLTLAVGAVAVAPSSALAEDGTDSAEQRGAVYFGPDLRTGTPELLGASPFLYPNLGARGERHGWMVDFSTQLPFLLIDLLTGAATGGATESSPDLAPLRGALNPYINRSQVLEDVGYYGLFRLDGRYAYARSGPSRYDFGGHFSEHSVALSKHPPTVSSTLLSTGPSIGWRILTPGWTASTALMAGNSWAILSKDRGEGTRDVRGSWHPFARASIRLAPSVSESVALYFRADLQMQWLSTHTSCLEEKTEEGIFFDTLECTESVDIDRTQLFWIGGMHLGVSFEVL